jgi:hypothetical protein
LKRPECILAERDGTFWAADARGGVARIQPDGAQGIVTQKYRNTSTTPETRRRDICKAPFEEGASHE